MVTETRVMKDNNEGDLVFTKVDSRRKELYNLTIDGGKYTMIHTIHELGIPSSLHGVFMGCVHLCDGDIQQAYDIYNGVVSGTMSIDAVIDALVHVDMSGTGVALYDCYESIVSSSYSSTRSIIRDEIEQNLRESLAGELDHIRDNNDPVQVVSIELPKNR